MGKLKIQKSENVIAIDFYTNLLVSDRLYNICCLFQLKDIYIDIYSTYNQKKNLYRIIVDNKLSSQIFCVYRKHLQDIHIKIDINNLANLLQLLTEFYFEEINIWDCYESWENYIEDKKDIASFFTFKSNKIINNKLKSNKFYLNYLPDEGNKVTIICDLAYKNQDLLRNLATSI